MTIHFASEPVKTAFECLSTSMTVTSALYARSEQPWKITSYLGGQFVVGEALYRRRPDLRCRRGIAAIPMGAPKVEHRDGIVWIERERFLICLDSLRPATEAMVRRSNRKPAHGVGLDSLSLL